MDATVIVPTRNRPALLGQTLRSILAQSYPVAVLVVDDASDEPVESTVRETADARVRVLRQSSQSGVAAARNRAVAEATTTYLAFCDDDDLWAPGKIAAQVAALESGPEVWAVTGAVNFHGEGVVERVVDPMPAQQMHARLGFANPVPGGCSNVLARRDAVEKAGSFDTTLRIMADWDLWVRLSRQSRPAVVNERLVARRLHEGNMSRDDGLIEAEIRHMEERTRDLRGGADFDERWLHLKLGNAAVNSADRRAALRHHSRAALRGDRVAARRLMATLALGVGPRRFAVTARRKRRREDLEVPWLAAQFATDDTNG